MDAAELIAEHTAPVRDLIEQVRAAVRGAMPEAEERVYVGWHGLGYVHPTAGYVCGIFPRRDSVKLGYEQGSELPDPDRLFAAGGNQVRYIVLQPGDAVPAAGIAELIDSAIELRAGT